MNGFPVVLVISCSSSSIKFPMLDTSDCEVSMSGTADGINSENAFLSVDGGEPAPLARHSYEGILKTIALELEKRNLNDSMALISHRIAHGGSIFTEPATITDEVIDNIRRVSPLAPLHNYTNSSDIESAQQLFPDVTQVTIFGTNFHQTTAPKVYLCGLPWRYYEKLGVRRCGFHGTSHRYVSQRAHSPLNLTENDSSLVVTHLDDGASICAIRNGQSVDTLVGMAPLEGLMMSIRSGDVDFGAVSWVASQTNQSLDDLERVVNKEPELLDISGLSSDLRVLEKAWHEGHKHVQLTIKTLVHRIARHIAGHAASLRRLDGIIFTDRVGENSSLIRRLVMEHLAVLGLEIGTEINNHFNSCNERIVPSRNACVICAVIPTNEKKMIALDAIHLDRVNASAKFV